MQSSKPIRVGAVSYLNTRPLVHRLTEFAPHIELVFDLPSRLADGLAAGNLDVALIPSVEMFADPSYTILSDACIGCRGPVLSVKLLGRRPLSETCTLALDEGSRTSVALTRILLKQRFGLNPELRTLPIDADPQSVDADALLLIGDRAIWPPTEGFVETWDLGEEWVRWSGLPFVFATWTARADVDLQGVGEALAAARDAGVADLERIARTEAPKVRLTPSQCLAYLRDSLYFYLGPRESEGLRLFHRHAVEMGLAPPGALRTVPSNAPPRTSPSRSSSAAPLC